jgi:hypothetical protein
VGEVPEAIMADFVVPIIASVIFLAVLIGLVVHALVVRREDRQYSLVNDAPGRLPGLVRRLNGVGRRDLDPELFRTAGTLVRLAPPGVQ